MLNIMAENSVLVAFLSCKLGNSRSGDTYYNYGNVERKNECKNFCFIWFIAASNARVVMFCIYPTCCHTNVSSVTWDKHGKHPAPAEKLDIARVNLLKFDYCFYPIFCTIAVVWNLEINRKFQPHVEPFWFG